jgi:hypothetical protein
MAPTAPKTGSHLRESCLLSASARRVHGNGGRGRKSRAETTLVAVLALSLPVGIALGLLRGDGGGSAAPAHRSGPAVPPSTPGRAPRYLQEGDPGFWPTGVAFWNAQHGVIVGGLAKGLRGCRSRQGEIA